MFLRSSSPSFVRRRCPRLSLSLPFLFVGDVSCRMWLFSPTRRCPSVCPFQRQKPHHLLSAFRNDGAYLLPSYPSPHIQLHLLASLPDCLSSLSIVIHKSLILNNSVRCVRYLTTLLRSFVSALLLLLLRSCCHSSLLQATVAFFLSTLLPFSIHNLRGGSPSASLFGW